MKNSTLANILNEDYSWRDEHRTEDYYLVQLRALNKVGLTFEPAYRFTHPLPDFSSKIRIHERVFINAVNEYLNQFNNILADQDECYIAFQLKKHRERIQFALKTNFAYLSTKQDLLKALSENACNFTDERETKESVIIVSYMFWALIWCNMEIQHIFANYIHPDNLLTINDHFYRILSVPSPKECYIQEITHPNSVDSNRLLNTPSEMDFSSYLPATKDIIGEEIQLFTEKAKPYGFFKLKKVQALSQNKQLKLIRKIQTAEKPYQIAIIHYLGWLEYFSDNRISKTDRANFFADLLKINTRDVKGYINALNNNSKEDQERYTSRLFVPDAEKFYTSLLTT